METSRTHFTASWGKLLTGTSIGVVALIGGATLAVAAAEGNALPTLLPLALLLAVPFMVRGYVVEGNILQVQRLLWTTPIPLKDLQSAEAVPNALRGSIRLFGNGGIFSFTGWFRSKALGKFRAFVNDLNRTVVLRFPDRTMVVSPDDPAAFVQTANSTIEKGTNGQTNVI